MNSIQFILFLFLVVSIQGCSTTTKVNTSSYDAPYLDQHFPYQGEIESAENMFVLTPEMRRYVNTRLSSPQMTTRKKAETLIRDLFSPSYMNITFRHDANYSPAETFEKGLANCMSLTMLAYVLADHAGLDTKFMSVEVEENWNVLQQTTLLNGHVNLEVTTSDDNKQVFYSEKRSFVIDFLPMLGTSSESKKALSKNEIIALFYNNRGAEALTNDNRELAYTYFKRASLLAPDISGIWGNLASLYRQAGFIDEAESIYYHARKLDPSNLNIQENLALLYKLTGREGRARAIYDKVYNQRKSNPYFYAMQAEQALLKNQPKKAFDLYKQAIKLDRREHTFYFGLAKSSVMLNKLDLAQKYLERATNLSKDEREKRKYQNKIAALSNLVAKAY